MAQVSAKPAQAQTKHFLREWRKWQGLSLEALEGIMEMCKDIDHFKQVARKQKTITVAPYLFDDMNRIID